MHLLYLLVVHTNVFVFILRFKLLDTAIHVMPYNSVLASIPGRLKYGLVPIAGVIVRMR